MNTYAKPPGGYPPSGRYHIPGSASGPAPVSSHNLWSVSLAKIHPQRLQSPNHEPGSDARVIWRSPLQKAAPRTIRCSTFRPRSPFKSALSRTYFFPASTTKTLNQRRRLVFLRVRAACRGLYGIRTKRCRRWGFTQSLEFRPRSPPRLASGFHRRQPQSRHPPPRHSHGPRDGPGIAFRRR